MQKNMFQIWVGDLAPPIEWMETWKLMHPDWNYQLIDNDYLFSRKFRCQHLIEAFFKAGKFTGVADLLRYEILLEQGGWIASADSQALHPVDELWDGNGALACYASGDESQVRQKNISPIMAAEIGNPFLELIVMILEDEPVSITEQRVWVAVGNRFLGKLIRKYDPDLTILPYYMFNPVHPRGESPTPPQGAKIYAHQFWGHTTGAYQKFNPEMKELGDRLPYIREIAKRFNG